MSDTGIGFQCTAGHFTGDQFRFMERHQDMVNMIITGYLGHTFTVRTVGEDKQFIGRLYGCADSCFHTVSTAALQQDSRIFVFAESGNGQQAFADRGHDTFVIIFIPGTPILEHGFAYCL